MPRDEPHRQTIITHVADRLIARMKLAGEPPSDVTREYIHQEISYATVLVLNPDLEPISVDFRDPPAHQAPPPPGFTQKRSASGLPIMTPFYSATERRHPASARFHALLAEAGAMHDAKQADYGRADDPFANVRASAEWGLPPWVGAMVRLNDKVRRLQRVASGNRLVNESAADSFMDIAVYALIAYVLYEEEHPA